MLTVLGRYWKRIIAILITIVAIGAIGFVVWASVPSGELMPQAQEALRSTDQVSVVRDSWLVFEPVDGEATTGLIFYPGGRVLVDDYAPLGQAVAEAGYLVVFVPMPLNLAVLDADAATAVIEAYASIEHWAVSGHSLGGAMAARYAHNHPDAVDGLIMMAAFPEAQFDFTSQEIEVASIYGSQDGLATVKEVESSASQLPDDTEFILIDGGNHAQFGWYGSQAGDHPALVSREAQYEQIVAGTLGVLSRISD